MSSEVERGVWVGGVELGVWMFGGSMCRDVEEVGGS